ncbi:MULTISPECIES: aerolysin family beta-barrel pore-forming toxin [unclassified Vibrio]|uniref:aerolysin family beta-barrel pore-forming toxin n=1 Tax=unclassified Vibrio TaxID=2614977 RepID=UPI000B8E3D31|nr:MULTISPECIES: aerolysin family beta-barrel pore-forming toxin [unclassified Vibrio]NAW97931.1 aerolysin family beta-barrel pore-forming toxin [Vibrio sp. V23_P3S9T160]OXX42807.1 hypothetical protein B9J85_11875 [Vibrio sp. V11_P1A41T118]
MRIYKLFKVSTLTAVLFGSYAYAVECSSLKNNSDSDIVDPANIVIFRDIGMGICEAGYRALTRKELRSADVRQATLKKLGRWETASLSNNWIIKGRGFKGPGERFTKDESSNNTVCYPESTETTSVIQDHLFPQFPPLIVEQGSEDKIEWLVFNDRDNFIKPAALLGYSLGFHNLWGNSAKNIGEDMTVTRLGPGEYRIKGNEEGYCQPNSCDKTSITVKNIEYLIDSDSFVLDGPVVTSGKQQIGSLVVPLENRTNSPQTFVVDLAYDANKSWSHTSSSSTSVGFKIGTTMGFSVSSEGSVGFPGIAGGKVTTTMSFSFTAETSMDNTASWSDVVGGSESTRVTVQGRPVLEPRSSGLAVLELYRADMTFPYRANVDMSYELEFDGPIRSFTNPMLSAESHRRHLQHSFLIGRMDKHREKSLDYLYDHRDIPGINTLWDWNKMSRMYGQETLLNRLGKVEQPKHSMIKGVIIYEESFAGKIELMDQKPLSGNTRAMSAMSRSAVSSAPADYSETERAIEQQLESYGFNNVQATVRLADDVPAN